MATYTYAKLDLTIMSIVRTTARYGVGLAAPMMIGFRRAVEAVALRFPIGSMTHSESAHILLTSLADKAKLSTRAGLKLLLQL